MPTAPPTFVISPERFENVIGDPVRWRQLTAAGERIRRAVGRRVLWNVTATAQGGIAELVRSYTSLARGIGIDARWEVIDGTPEFFALSRRIHNELHGESFGAAQYDDADRRIYEQTVARNANDLLSRIAPDDVVILHGPPMAPLVPAIREAAAHPVWRCHVGLDAPNDAARRAWRFLMPYVEPAEAYVFSRPQFVWEGLDRAEAFVVPPTLDPFSPKNQELNPAVVDAILAATGLQEDGVPEHTGFVRLDGTPGRVNRRAELIELAPLPRHVPLVVQSAPWNRLKDPALVIDVFARQVPSALGAHLVVAGPAVEGVSDESEAREVFAETLERWRDLPPDAQARVHVAQIPVDDADESAVIVNALQRRASVVLQKSRGEGFGMTALEAAWKSRPVVCSRVGGLQDHVIDGVTGYLIDRDDREGAANAITKLLVDSEIAQRMGAAGRTNVRAHYLVPSAAPTWAAVLEHVERGPSDGSAAHVAAANRSG